MRCSRCNRSLKSPAVISDGRTLGPTCARLLGLAIRGTRDKRVVAQAGQLALFEVVPA